MSNETKKSFTKLPVLSRMVGASLLHKPTLDELKADETANYQAVLVVVLASLAIGIGVGPGQGIPIGVMVWWVSWWAVWVSLVFLTWPVFASGQKVVPKWSHLARPTGFAQSPVVFMSVIIFTKGFDPSVGLIIFTLVGLWWFSAISAATKQALDLKSTPKAVMVSGTYLIPSIIIELGWGGLL